MRNWSRRFWRRFRALFDKGAVERELADEMRHHLEQEARELGAIRGLEPGEARRQALLAFGGVERFKEVHRDVRGVRWLEDLGKDLAYAVRSLRRTPGFTFSAVVVLAIGIGASTAVYSAVNAVLFARLPYPDSDRLIRIYEQNSPTNRWGLSVADFQGIVERQRSLVAVGIMSRRRAPVAAAGEPSNVAVGLLTSGLLRALDVRPAEGRLFEGSDDAPGAPLAAVLGHAYAAATYGSPRSALGKTISIDGVSHVVVGVLPAGVADLAGFKADIWGSLQVRPPERRGPFGLLAVARIKSDATLESARRDLAAISEAIFPLWAAGFQDRSARLTPVPLRTAIVGDAGRTLGILAAAVGLVLLIGIANVASLMLVRTVGRSRELALRTALGATRARLTRLVVVESLTLAMTGAAAGLLVGQMALRILATMGRSLPRLGDARLDLAAMGFAVGVALLAGLAVGAYPIVVLVGRGATSVVGSGHRTVGAGRRTEGLRTALVATEFALALPLLAGAGLLLNSFLRLVQVNPGFDPAPLATFNVSLPQARYPNEAAVELYWRKAVSRLKELPDVVEVGLTQTVPPNEPSIDINNFDLVDRPVPSGGAQPVSPWIGVTSEYFTALGVRLVEGRLFTPADTGSASPVLLVSESWARRYFPGASAIGRKLISGGCVSCPLSVVAGVVGDIKYLGLGQSADAVYYPLTAGWSRDLSAVVRTRGPPVDAIARLRAEVATVDPDVPVDGARPLADRVTDSVSEPRQWTTLVGGFAAAALGLAAIGIFGMLSFTVRTRWREIGVQMALGADRRTIVTRTLQRGMRPAVLGSAVGLGLSVLATRWLAGTLYEVRPGDPATLTTVTVLLLVVAVLACWLPAVRAAAIDPVDAIRVE